MDTRKIDAGEERDEGEDYETEVGIVGEICVIQPVTDWTVSGARGRRGGERR